MLLTITTTHRPATDLGYLVHKNPARLQSVSTSFGRAWVFYPEATEERCTFALALEIDPVQLVRGKRREQKGSIDQYVNDRPYVASSFLTVAMGRTLREALAGRSKERPELAGAAIPLEATLSAVPSRGGEGLLRGLFEPLGYEVECKTSLLDDSNPEWGPSPYFGLTLRAKRPLAELLTHLYVLVPVLDNAKHYWIGDDEVEKLLRRGEGWLDTHPAKEEITRRYLGHRRSLVRAALDRLVRDEVADPDDASADAEEAEIERPMSLNDRRLGAVVAALKASGARSVVDLGCGEGNLLRELMNDHSFEKITGVDASHRALEVAARRLRIERFSERQAERLRLLHGALTYRDRRLEGVDAAALVEVIEHIDADRVPAVERVIFNQIRPMCVVVTTPNVEYNVLFENPPASGLRHRDHRFEWTRAEFRAWAERCAEEYGYTPQFVPIGDEDPEHGPPTQMAVFTRGEGPA